MSGFIHCLPSIHTQLPVFLPVHLGLVSFARSVLIPTWYQKLGQLATRGDLI